MNHSDKLQDLKEYINNRDDIAFAFLFGSAARGRMRKEGDIDVAVYFKPEKDIDWEAFGKTFKGENRIVLDLERLLGKEVDLVVLNRARAIVADEIIRRGKPITIKDKGLFMDFLCIITDEAEYVRDSIVNSYKEREVAPGR
ncbi:MAG: nucleotidyltransferase domain-containing protein [Thermodesulfobacteriota bacterium]|nr:nucleotidyltransferase domain-containing protein [Thermodesulfobacteriota bacterium]